MKKSFAVILICLIAISLSSCASITTGRFQRVAIESNPQDANVTISSGHRGVTPCSFDLQRNKNHVIKISKKGYKTAQVMLKKTICGSTAGNLIIGGVIGLGVDAMTGAMFRLIPENVSVDLVPGSEEEIIEIAPPKSRKKEAEEQAEKEKKGTGITTKEQ